MSIRVRTKNQEPRGVRGVRKYWYFLKMMQVSPWYFLIQIVSSLCVAGFDGLSLGLLAPLLKGIIEKDFSFLGNITGVPWLMRVTGIHIQDVPSRFLFLGLVGVIFVSALLKNVVFYLSQVYMVKQREGSAFYLKNFVFQRYLTFGKLYLDKISQGYIQSDLLFADRVVRLLDALGKLLIAGFTLVVYFSIMVFVEWRLALFAVVVLPALHFSLRWLIKKIRRTAQLQSRVALKMGRQVFDILSGITVVHAYNKEEPMFRRFRQINDDIKRHNISQDKKLRMIQPFQEVLTMIAILFFVSAVAFIFVTGRAGQVSEYFLFLILVRRCAPVLIQLNRVKSDVAQLDGPMNRLLKVAEEKDKHVVSSGEEEFSGINSHIEIRNLNFQYRQHLPVVRGVSFTIPKGQMTAIVGPTGSGKTTLINLIMRFYECPPGTIFLDGKDIREYSIESLRRSISLVSQEVTLFNDTLKNNVLFGSRRDQRPGNEEVLSVFKKARLDEFVAKLPQGIHTEIGDRGVRLSGGEKQRVSIARALLRQPDIMILDEATSSLDTTTERLVQEAIEEAVKGRTAIVIAHRLSTVKNADKIVVIEEGRKIEEGHLSELIERRGAFYHYWQAQRFE
ncbi:MAG: ATP-binding cassette domain-containing protein [Candidatus Omnitrophica bacterium]|nr:ATP-binding cassette domain-containing protein [Candidatus Omnitrophota bacterium]